MAEPTPAPSPIPEPGPFGTLNVAVPQLGALNFALPNEDFYGAKFNGLITHETMFREMPDGTIGPLLVKGWDVHPSGLDYTFHLQEGVPWHRSLGDFGDFYADDFIFSLEKVMADDSIHPAARSIRRVFFCDGCNLLKINDLTVLLERPTPTYELTWYSRQPDVGLELHSKLHFDTAGEERRGQTSSPWAPDPGS